MASAVGTNPAMVAPDTPIVIKVSVDDTVRRFKLPLSDVTPSKFATKLRQLLQIDASKQLILERYSDSASSYITLDTSNPPSYKQLYRAAKAKTKLRLKATVVGAVEQADKQQQKSRAAVAEAPALAPVNEALNKLKLNVTTQASSFGPAWHVCCNNCDKAMLDAHYHCGTCENGDYDLCEACVSRGVTCLVAEHWLIKRNIRNGQVINSTTERLTPKPKPTPVPVAAPAAVPVAAPVAAPVAVPVSTPVARATVPPAAAVTFAATIPEKSIPGSFASDESKVLLAPATPDEPKRTCNACVKVLPEKLLVNCSDCADFDLCIACIKGDGHGHHPGHRFTAIADERLAADVHALCQPGRGQAHWATCDGCDQRISGVRHKCLDCPDWDLCAKCHAGAAASHPRHRFVPVYGKMSWALPRKPHHQGVLCDGPLCGDSKVQSYIQGVRYKCAICHDTDFCANCEAHPGNKHNATHPLIMFKTPVRKASISTLGETALGQPMPAMGDAAAAVATPAAPVEPSSSSSSLLTTRPAVNHGPTDCYNRRSVAPEPEPEPEPEQPVQVTAVPRKPAPLAKPKQVEGSELDACFVRDAVADGSTFAINQEFEQVWTLRNPGPHTWPAGVVVRNTGGDNMLNIDPFRPASSSELSAAQSTRATHRPVGPNDEFAFSVTLRSPLNPGKHISYWRARAPDGTPFGHKLWCEIQVNTPGATLPPPYMPVSGGTDAAAAAPPSKSRGSALADYQMQLMLLERQNERRRQMALQFAKESEEFAHLRSQEQEKMEKRQRQQQQQAHDMPYAAPQDGKEQQLESTTSSSSSSQMIFPKLEKESPASSTHLDEAKGAAATAHNDLDSVEFVDDDDSDDDTFLTDDEYDILDASDEEVIVDNGVPVSK